MIDSPIIDKETDVKRVNPGESVTFECIAEGLPTPITTWIHPDESIVTNATERMTVIDTITFQDGVHGTQIISKLVIEDIVPDSDYGTYVCEARNSIGQDPDVLLVDLNDTSKKLYFLVFIGVNTILFLIRSWKSIRRCQGLNQDRRISSKTSNIATFYTSVKTAD